MGLFCDWLVVKGQCQEKETHPSVFWSSCNSFYLSQERFHLQRPGCWVARMDLVEDLKDLIGWCTGSHHIGSLRRGEGDSMLQTTCIHSHALPGATPLIKYLS